MAFLSRLIGTRRRSSTSGIGACIGASGLSPPQHRTLRMQSSRHRRAISLTSETASLIARKDACAAHGGSIGGSRRGSGGSAACTAQMLELVSAPASLRLRCVRVFDFLVLCLLFFNDIVGAFTRICGHRHICSWNVFYKNFENRGKCLTSRRSPLLCVCAYGIVCRRTYILS